MCGIVGYIGSRDMAGLLLDGLQRLEYRGYDSCGIAILDNGTPRLARSAGRIAGLAQKLKEWGPFGIHAEGYPAGEMKHGPIALIDSDMPVFASGPAGSRLQKDRGQRRGDKGAGRDCARSRNGG